MIKLTPPLGWNSWNTFASNINEELIKETADKMVETGLLDCGYDYLVIDDCWSERVRDENGVLVADKQKFPHGMKAVADYVHSKGLKFGMYSCVGMLTCAGYPGSFEHEFIDAKTFAEWGVDFLKYDYCYRPRTISGDTLYKRMGTALANCGRDILFIFFSWGADETQKWIKSTGAHMWRSTGDIFDTWTSIKEIALKQKDLLPFNGLGCFNDMDMLVVGMNGSGHVGLKGCTTEEYITHFSLWALLGSPLMIGCDIRNMTEETKNILMNKDVLAINQDVACLQPYSDNSAEDRPIYFKRLENGDLAIGMFNLSDSNATLDMGLDIIGLPESCGKTLKLKNLWTKEEKNVENCVIRENIDAHGCVLFRAKVVDR